MSKSAYALVQKTRYRITLEITLTSKKMDQIIDIEKVKWHKLLDLQSGESVNVEVEKYDSAFTSEMECIFTLDLSVFDDFDPHQIEWKKLIENWTKLRVVNSKSYVEVLDAPYSW